MSGVDLNFDVRAAPVGPYRVEITTIDDVQETMQIDFEVTATGADCSPCGAQSDSYRVSLVGSLLLQGLLTGELDGGRYPGPSGLVTRILSGSDVIVDQTASLDYEQLDKGCQEYERASETVAIGATSVAAPLQDRRQRCGEAL